MRNTSGLSHYSSIKDGKLIDASLKKEKAEVKRQISQLKIEEKIYNNPRIS